MLMASRVAPPDGVHGPVGPARADTTDTPDAAADPAEAPGAARQTDRARPADTALATAERGARPHWLRELVLMASVYLAYSGIRNLAPDQATQAQSHARTILRAEDVIGMDVERAMNLFVSDRAWLAIPAIYYYATLHLVVTAGVMVWLYRRRPAHYAQARGVLLVMTLIALVGYWLYPLAPPRLMPNGGYVDTAVKYELWGYTPSEAVVSLSNQYAAMPSMHFGWALWVGVVLVLLARHRLVRALGIAYPLLTLAVIVVTANHFVLDAVAALLIFAVSPVILQGFAMIRRRAVERRELAAA